MNSKIAEFLSNAKNFGTKKFKTFIASHDNEEEVLKDELAKIWKDFDIKDVENLNAETEKIYSAFHVDGSLYINYKDEGY